MKNKNRQRTRTVFVITALIFLALLFLVKLPFLVIQNQSGKNILTFSTLTNKSFSYNYIHSVQKTPCAENFIVSNNRLVLTSTVYKSLGVGLPFSPDDGKLMNDNGNFVLTGLNRSYREINFRAMPVAAQELIVKGKEYQLNDYFAPGALISVKITNYTPVQILLAKI
ncbi:hypothetical protein SAMN05660649_04171 [Desulfotomaculum arcticum]|uniref:DUF1850 domain-containing protein n=1 Tax=Desulfotruncus arcticus DSM 17038 TaxID=1121424 RepID=A0A1I2Y194_9FIRM|nr:DUF1850 domain-containing protein [Desulfotruncus arcticus]SFH18081.1 hypothetical protein SAMN05660649_04171 [Desulfotomaculum arcticum] [Desulfotruncus arcticus DSM 17038]